MKTNSGSHFVGCIDGRQLVFGVFAQGTLVTVGALQLAGTEAAAFKTSCVALLSSLGYTHEPISLLLPTSFATCRSVNIPATRAEEIEKIASFQAHRFLPASLGALITGFQVLSLNKNGTADINLVIAPTNVIEQYVNALKTLSPVSISITIQAFGIFSLCNSLRLLPKDPAYIFGITGSRIECAIAAAKGLFVCRSFDIPLDETGIENLFAAEMRKINETYQKENSAPLPRTAVIFSGPRVEETAQTISRLTGAASSLVDVTRHISARPGALAAVRENRYPIAAIAGIGRTGIPAALNLVTDDIKQAQRKNAEKSDIYQSIAFACFAAILLIAALMADLKQKRACLESLKSEIHAIEKEAREIENLESMVSYTQTSAPGFPSVIDTLAAAFKLTPADVSLENFSYEPENRQIVFKGQASKLNDVFVFVSNIENNPLFEGFSPKINYATEQQGTAKSAIIFELRCAKID